MRHPNDAAVHTCLTPKWCRAAFAIFARPSNCACSSPTQPTPTHTSLTHTRATYTPQVVPVTMVRSDDRREHAQTVAVSDRYICYGLKAGQIRVLNRATATRALFKGHPQPLAAIAFFGGGAAGAGDTGAVQPQPQLLASISKAGDLVVRAVTEPEGAEGPVARVLMTGSTAAAGSGGLPRLAWHPLVPQILAVASGPAVSLFVVPAADEGGEGDATEPSLPGIELSVSAPGASVTSLAFSASGELLAASDSSGAVSVWRLEGGDDNAEPPSAPIAVLRPYHGEQPVASALFVAAGGCEALLTGNAANRSLALWQLPGAEGGAAVKLASFELAAAQAGAGSFFNHLYHVPELQLLVLGNGARPQASAAGCLCVRFNMCMGVGLRASQRVRRVRRSVAALILQGACPLDCSTGMRNAWQPPPSAPHSPLTCCPLPPASCTHTTCRYMHCSMV